MRYFLLLFIIIASCTKEVKYSKEALLSKALKADPTISFMLPKNLSEGVSCADYPAGCLSAHLVRVKNLDMIAVEFMTEGEARLAAKKLRGYYARNWLLDDVTGEPVLEKFVTEGLEAKRP